MFDDESDMMPQNHWVGPEEDVQAIDAVLNHRLRDDISMPVTIRVPELLTDLT